MDRKKINEYNRKWYAKNRKRIRANNKIWRDKNPEKMQAYWQQQKININIRHNKKDK